MMSEMNKDVAPQSADRALESVDAGKRETLRKLILGAAFVAPVVATFSIDGLVSRARASSYCGNQVYSGCAPT
jgi:hypothetical protein